MEHKPIGHALHALNATMNRYIDAHSHKRKHAELTGANTWVLLFIAESDGSPIYVRDIERQFGITRSSASKVADILVRSGFIERSSVEIDGRLRRLTLSDKGKALIHDIEQDRAMVEEALLRGFTNAERNTAHSLLERMRQNLEDSDARLRSKEAFTHD